MADEPTTSEARAGRQWLTVREVAEQLSVSRDTVERWIHNGQLRAVDVSAQGNGKSRRTCWRINQADLATFLERRASMPTPRTRPRRKPKHQDVIEFIK